MFNNRLEAVQKEYELQNNIWKDKENELGARLQISAVKSENLQERIKVYHSCSYV